MTLFHASYQISAPTNEAEMSRPKSVKRNQSLDWVNCMRVNILRSGSGNNIDRTNAQS